MKARVVASASELLAAASDSTIAAIAVKDNLTGLPTFRLSPGQTLSGETRKLTRPYCSILPRRRLRAYARETVVAEKFQAMVALGKANSRMKDFYDIWVLSKTYDFNNARLAQAIAAAFARRQTAIPEAPSNMPLRLKSFATKASCSDGQLLFAISLRRFHHLKR
jgi:hypothetical protein